MSFIQTAKKLKSTFNKNFYQKAKFIPSAEETQQVFCGFKDLLFQFPVAENTHSKNTAILEDLTVRLERLIANSLCFLCEKKGNCSLCAEQAHQIARQFSESLPDIQKLLITDINAAYEGDPAAVNPVEPLLCYPGITAITFQRMAHFLYERGVRLIPRIATEYAHSLTGIDIHPGAKIGPAFFIDHGTGVVIGETCVIGANVKLYQGVTLGAKSFTLDENGNPVKGIKRHPNIEDNVVIYAETTVLGNVTIGKNSILGANKWITQDIPANSKIN